MDFIREPTAPPRREAYDGRERRVGVEIEFAAVSARQGAEIVKGLFGGRVREEDPHRFHVEGTEFGEFTVEIDTQYAHRPKGGSGGEGSELFEDFRAEMRRLFGDIGSVVLPCEVVCPPIPWHELGRLDALVEALREAGAEGTRSSPFYAFGAQLNPEIASEDPEHIASVLKAYLLLSPWLRAVMSLDVTRRLVAFADPFPDGYVRHVTAGSYRPDRTRLIEDYLEWNPTRNRELDMLPLFAWMEPELVEARVDDVRVKPRPTFHYRLPDADLGEVDWSLSLEWNRWLVVERLAGDAELLDRMGEAWARRRQGWLSDRWAMESTQWLLLSRPDGP
jgi:hypothetical protein